MLTMERKQLKSGDQILCYVGDYGFTEFKEYSILQVNRDGYIVKDEDGIEVLFETESDLKQTFMIEN